MALGASSVRNRARSIAYRWGPVAVVKADGPELLALGVRYDEEDLATSETFVLRLGPGRAEAIDGMIGTSLAVAAGKDGLAFVLDARGTVHAGARRHKLQGARALCGTPDGGVVVAGGARLWRIDAAGEGVRESAVVKARLLSGSRAGVACATDDNALALVDGEDVRGVPVKDAKGAVAALHLDDDGRIIAAVGRTIVDGDHKGVAAIATAPWDVDAVGRFRDRLFVSSKVHGLWVVEDGKVQKLRPSVRAHTITTSREWFVASASLCIATSDDAMDYLTRDLAPFIRIAEKTMPRFLQPDDAHV